MINKNLKYLLLAVPFALVANGADAAKLTLFPQSGNISVEKFDLSVLAESVESEPGMVSAEVVVNYSGDVKAVDVKSTAFETIESKEITDNQVKFVVKSNPAAPKSGTVRAGMITFEATKENGAANLSFDATSKIIGQNSANILTEKSENATYNISIAQKTETATQKPTETTKTEVPKTGVVNNYTIWTAIASVMVLAGYIVWNKK